MDWKKFDRTLTLLLIALAIMYVLDIKLLNVVIFLITWGMYTKINNSKSCTDETKGFAALILFLGLIILFLNNFMGVVMILIISFVYSEIERNETNEFIKSLVFFGFLLFLNKLLEVPYFSEPPASTVIRGIFFLAFIDFIFSRKGYTQNIDSGTVLENRTGLMWQQFSIGQTWDNGKVEGESAMFSYDDALNITSNCAGVNDWRLPTIDELKSITIDDRGLMGLIHKSAPIINTSMFPNTPIEFFWSSSVCSFDNTTAKGVHFRTGEEYEHSVNKEGCVRLVRNLTESEKDQIKLKSLNSKKRKWKSVLYAIILSVAFGLFIKYEGGYTKQALQEEFIAEYVDNSDGTVTHTKTGLIWQRCSVGQTWGKNTCEGDAEEFTWDEAVKFATNNAGWRLPTNAEMINLIHCSDNNYEKSDEGEYRICATNKFTSFPITVSPTINSVIFPYTPKEFFWSPTESGKKAWGVGFYTGLHGTHDKDYKGYIRLVRNVDTTANAITVESNNESISGQSKNLDMIDNNPPAINGLENVDDAEQPQHYMGKDQVTEDYLKQEIQDLKKEVEQLKQETEKNNLKIEKSNIAQLSYLNLSSDNLSIAKNVEQPPITTEVTLAEQSELKQLSQNWIIAHSSKDITLFSSLYDDFILFYGTKKNRNSTLEAKLRLFKKFPDLQQQIYGDIQFEKQTDGTIKGDFTKRVRVTITQGITDYPAYLIFKKSNNGWKIAAESDLQTDKNIAKKSNTSDVDSVVD